MKDDNKITSIFGGPTAKREVSQECVEAITQWLEMAKSGEIVGIAMGAVCSNGVGMSGIAGEVFNYTVLGGLTVAQHSICTEIEAGYE